MLAADKSLAKSRDIGDGWSAVMMACHFGNPAILELLIAAGAPLNATDFNNDQDAVMVCAENGQADCLRLLIKAKVDVKRTARINYGRLPMEMNALHMAAWKKKPAIVGLLIEAGINVNTRAKSYAMFSPLHFAATEGDVESVSLLLKAGADKEAGDGRRNINALQMAEAGKHEACVELLRKK
jgi:ankyrin repeat protein